MGLTESLALEGFPLGIRVNALCPGWFPSEMTVPMQEDNAQAFIARKTPMARMGHEHELDGALLLLAGRQRGAADALERSLEPGHERPLVHLHLAACAFVDEDTGRAVSIGSMRADLVAMKRFGFNAVRESVSGVLLHNSPVSINVHHPQTGNR